MVKEILLVGCGGFVGAVGRYLFGGWIHRLFRQADFPYGTLGVNLLGCLVIGLLAGLADQRELFGPDTRLFVFIGMLGAFTTFSTFSYETLALLRDGQTLSAFVNIVISVIAGLLLAFTGYKAACVL
jgi:CrcB protein